MKGQPGIYTRTFRYRRIAMGNPTGMRIHKTEKPGNAKADLTDGELQMHAIVGAQLS